MQSIVIPAEVTVDEAKTGTIVPYLGTRAGHCARAKWQGGQS
jgi:hypothetical protein